MAVVKVVGIGETGMDMVCEIWFENIIKGISSYILISRGYKVMEISNGGQVVRYGIGKGQEKNIKGINGSDLIFVITSVENHMSLSLAKVTAASALSAGALVIGVLLTSAQSQAGERDERLNMQIHDFLDCVNLCIPINPDSVFYSFDIPIIIDSNNFCIHNLTHLIIKNMVEIIERPGIINVVFPEIRAIIGRREKAQVMLISVSGENGAYAVLEKINAMPPDCLYALGTAQGLIINITAGENTSISDFGEIVEIIESFTQSSTQIVFNGIIDDKMRQCIVIAIIILGRRGCYV